MWVYMPSCDLFDGLVLVVMSALVCSVLASSCRMRCLSLVDLGQAGMNVEFDAFPRLTAGFVDDTFVELDAVPRLAAGLVDNTFLIPACTTYILADLTFLASPVCTPQDRAVAAATGAITAEGL